MNNITSHPLHTIFPKEGKIGKALTWVSVGMYAYTLGKSAQATYKKFQNKRYKYSISIDSYAEDDLFDSAMMWLTKNYPNEKYNNYTLSTFWHARRTHVVGAATAISGQSIDLNGVSSFVVLSTEDRRDEDNTSNTFKTKQLVFYFTSKGDLDKSVKFLADQFYQTLNRNSDSDPISVAEAEVAQFSRYFNYVSGSWNSHPVIPRTLDSVILKKGDKERIVEDIDRFLSLRSDYLRIGIPWHRGYLLYGPPGTGKTSISLALSEHVGLAVFVLSLNSVRSDTDLLRAVSSVSEYVGYKDLKTGTVLVLEDIDTVSVTNSRELGRNVSSSDSVSLAGLLNVLDGALTPSGMLIIMTTNYRDRIDPALLRPGRIDFELSVDYLDQHQLDQMFTWYFGEDRTFPTPLLPSGVKITPADISGVVKNLLSDPDRCYAEICQLISDRTDDVRLDQVVHYDKGGIVK